MSFHFILYKIKRKNPHNDQLKRLNSFPRMLSPAPRHLPIHTLLIQPLLSSTCFAAGGALRCWPYSMAFYAFLMTWDRLWKNIVAGSCALCCSSGVLQTGAQERCFIMM